MAELQITEAEEITLVVAMCNYKDHLEELIASGKAQPEVQVTWNTMLKRTVVLLEKLMAL